MRFANRAAESKDPALLCTATNAERYSHRATVTKIPFRAAGEAISHEVLRLHEFVPIWDELIPLMMTPLKLLCPTIGL